MNTKTISSVFILAVLFALLAIVSAEFYLNEDYILDDEFDEDTFFAEVLSESAASTCSISGFPTYKQCDTRWGKNKLGSSSTICKVGCLMTSVASGLAKFKKKVGGKTSTPATLNSFLRSNRGYQGNLFVWGSVTRFGLKYSGKTKNHTTIKNAICSGRAIVVLNVNKGGHWVLATGVTGSGYRVMDPGYSRTSYTRGAVVQAAIYRV